MKLKFFILIIVLWKKNIKKKIINRNERLKYKMENRKSNW